jgi:hypothetical protein
MSKKSFLRVDQTPQFPSNLPQKEIEANQLDSKCLNEENKLELKSKFIDKINELSVPN